MNEEEEREREIFLLMARLGYTHEQALRYYELMHGQKPQPTRQTESETLKLENEKRKSELLDQITEVLGEETEESQDDILFAELQEKGNYNMLIKAYVVAIQVLVRGEADSFTISANRIDDGDAISFDVKFFDKDGSRIYFGKNGEKIIHLTSDD